MKILELRKNGTRRVYTPKSEKPSRTDQSFKKDCDVNEIVRKFTKTGQITHLAKRPGHYSDVSEIPDLHQAMDQVVKAQSIFNSLPAAIRKRFANSPQEMLDFLSDPKNDEEAVKLGLKVPRKKPEPVKEPDKEDISTNDDSNDDKK